MTGYIAVANMGEWFLQTCLYRLHYEKPQLGATVYALQKPVRKKRR